MLQRIVVEILVLSAVLVACSPGKAEVVTPMVNTPEVLKAARESSTATPRAPLVPTEAVMEISSSSDPGETILGAGTPTVTATAKVINRRVEAIDDFKMNQFLLPFDGIRPIYDPEFVAAEHALYQDEELVMGVAWEGEAKAYPVTVLRFREMVNDELADIPILVTW